MVETGKFPGFDMVKVTRDRIQNIISDPSEPALLEFTQHVLEAEKAIRKLGRDARDFLHRKSVNNEFENGKDIKFSMNKILKNNTEWWVLEEEFEATLLSDACRALVQLPSLKDVIRLEDELQQYIQSIVEAMHEAEQTPCQYGVSMQINYWQGFGTQRHQV